jgi:mercuric ion binding protein
VSGITWAKLDFEKKNIAVTFVSGKASPATLTKATSDAGYPSTVHN